MDFSPRVVAVWKRVAFEGYSRHPLRVKREQVHCDAMRSHGDAIHPLDLPCWVVAPESLWQIRKEES